MSPGEPVLRYEQDRTRNEGRDRNGKDGEEREGDEIETRRMKVWDMSGDGAPVAGVGG